MELSGAELTPSGTTKKFLVAEMDETEEGEHRLCSVEKSTPKCPPHPFSPQLPNEKKSEGRKKQKNTNIHFFLLPLLLFLASPPSQHTPATPPVGPVPIG